MPALGSKLRHREQDGLHTLHWYCPGCEGAHAIRVRAVNGATPEPSWGVSGTPEVPTFDPSVLVSHDGDGGRVTVCHCFIREGFVLFLADCQHALAGQKVPLPDWPEGYGGP